ncbi:Flp pilus major pilin [Syntrophotalea carbinolica DSM 2380]|uniref:Flp pilus major pilin n=1 Tax=Syntrophotalea carbinolica (strain DSM 2380 / NBRC 103641 / GraBd1) TaxID=338963 RepID=Q0C6K4_SYNC1|nr:Flp family type IVb pilin [Syntrophotalea carbinolica]ABI81934.1 Flp pilus major pilin [Syntrophotalea carbinolica DSM 2380]
MNFVMSKLRDLVWKEEGATSPEYAVMLALIIIVCIAAISYLGKKVNNTFNDMAQQYPDN